MSSQINPFGKSETEIINNKQCVNPKGGKLARATDKPVRKYSEIWLLTLAASFTQVRKMPYKYIGRTHDFRGKSLWEILGNLKNYGIGRIVARNMLERYPEPSYMKILKVETLPNPEEPSIDDLRKVRVWVEKTFRGKTEPKPIVIESASYKTDYKLIPKDEEQDYCKKIAVANLQILPRTMEFPPIMKELLKREAKIKGQSLQEVPKLEIVYNKHSMKQYRIATDSEKANVEIVCGLGTPIAPRLYENIKSC